MPKTCRKTGVCFFLHGSRYDCCRHLTSDMLWRRQRVTQRSHWQVWHTRLTCSRPTSCICSICRLFRSAIWSQTLTTSPRSCCIVALYSRQIMQCKKWEFSLSALPANDVVLWCWRYAGKDRSGCCSLDVRSFYNMGPAAEQPSSRNLLCVRGTTKVWMSFEANLSLLRPICESSRR